MAESSDKSRRPSAQEEDPKRASGQTGPDERRNSRNSSAGADDEKRKDSLNSGTGPDQVSSIVTDEDDESDPELAAKRRKMTMKNKLAVQAEMTIKNATHNVVYNEDRSRLKFLFIFIAVIFVSIVLAVHVYLLNDTIGPPPTQDAYWAASLLLYLLLMNAGLAALGFVILYLKFGQLQVGLTWITMLMVMEYLTSISIAKAGVTVRSATFEDIKSYSKEYFDEFRLIPDYVAHYEIVGNCCGWGNPKKLYASWPELLQTNDLPDSCCVTPFYGCGADAVPRTVPSGYVMTLSSVEYGALYSNYRDQVDTELWTDEENAFSQVLRQFPPNDGVPDELLRLVDQILDAPMFYLMSAEFSDGPEPLYYVYKSFGQIENYRLNDVIKNKTCDVAIILSDTKTHSLYILIYAVVQAILCLLMAFVFWYYFLDIRAEILAAQPLSGDFYTLQMEQICIDARFEDILSERKRLEKIKELEQKELEKRRQRRLIRLAKEAAAAEEGEPEK